MNTQSTIYIAGHQGLVGSPILRSYWRLAVRLKLSSPAPCRLDLTKKPPVQAFFAAAKPAQVFLAAANAGGTYAYSTYSAEVMYQKPDDSR